MIRITSPQCGYHVRGGASLVSLSFKSVACPVRVLTHSSRLNGVPLRRVNQAYVIATSTKVDIGSVSVPESVSDSFFAKPKGVKSTKEGEFFGEGEQKVEVPEAKKTEQKVSDHPYLTRVRVSVSVLGSSIRTSHPIVDSV